MSSANRDLWSLLLRRILQAIVTICLIVTLLFVGVELLPGDPAETILGQNATPEAVANMRKAMKLDVPATERFFVWVGGVLQGDLGVSMLTDRPIADDFGFRGFNTLFLALFAAVFAIPISIFLGLVAALRHDTRVDRAICFFSLASISFPEFFVGYVLISVFASELHWFPILSQVSADMPLGERLYRMTLPAVTLSFLVGAYILRVTRATIITIMSKPYIEMAELKGVSRRQRIFKHALANAIGPIANVVALSLAYMVVGIVVVEVVFTYPGLGQWMVDSVAKHDMNVIQICGLAFGATYVLLNMTADIVAYLANPRLRYKR